MKTADEGKKKRGTWVRQREIRWNGLPTTNTHVHTPITHAVFCIQCCINIFILNEADLSLDRDDIFLFSLTSDLNRPKKKKAE